MPNDRAEVSVGLGTLAQRSLSLVLALGLAACGRACSGDATNDSPSGTPQVVGGDTPLLNEVHTGNYSTLPVRVPAGDLHVTYTLGPGCTGVVATLGGEILRQSNAGLDALSGTTDVSSPKTAGVHPLLVTASDGCRWTIQVAPKR
jgi:hypothetical protein